MPDNMIVLLIEPVLAHYRRDLYENYLRNTHFDFKIIGGKDYQGIKSLQNGQFETLDYNSIGLFKHRFYYLRRSIRYTFSIRPDVIICSGVDFHLIHTLIIYFLYHIFLRRDFYWWSHGTMGNQGKIGQFMRKLFYRFSSGVFVYSVMGKDNLLEMGVKPTNIQVVNNSINKSEYGCLSGNLSYKTPADGTFSILFCGRITKGKKLEVLLQALAYMKQKYALQLRCKIVGGGGYDFLQKMADELDILDIVDFVGEKYGEELFIYFQSANIFVYPGGIGLSLLQALSFGLPVITTDNIHLHGPEIELILPGKNGDFFQDGSYENLAERIIYWKKKISESEEEIRTVCINVIKEKGYLPDKMSSLVMDYLKERYFK